MSTSGPQGSPRRQSMVAGLALLLAGVASGAVAQNGSTAVAAPAARQEARFDTLRPDNYFRDWMRARQSPESFASTGSFYTQSVAFDRPDGQQEMVAGYYRTLSDSLGSLLETSYLPNPQGLSEWSVLGQMGAMFGDGWGMQAGLRLSELGLWGLEGRRVDAQLGLLTIEKVWSSYRSQYTVFSSRKDSGFAGGGHRVSLDYLYGSGNSVGLAYGRAWTSYQDGVGTAPGTAYGNNLGVTGEHWLARGWAVNYDALFQQGGEQRGLAPEIRVGLRLAF